MRIYDTSANIKVDKKRAFIITDDAQPVALKPVVEEARDEPGGY